MGGSRGHCKFQKPNFNFSPWTNRTFILLKLTKEIETHIMVKCSKAEFFLSSWQ